MSWNPYPSGERPATLTEFRAEWLADVQLNATQAGRSSVMTSTGSDTLYPYTSAQEGPLTESFPLHTIRRRNPAEPPRESEVQQHEEHPVQAVQEEWSRIQDELPPQISGRNIQFISIGGVIGTGLFIGTSTALRDGGPAGVVIGYTITGSIVYAVVVSLAEMVAYLPNVGGPVGLADLYVDRALGFAMGWNAWYHWTIILPTELAAASILASFYVPPGGNYESNVKKVTFGTTSVFLFFAVLINCLGRYGQYEFYFSTIKIFTIVALIIIGTVIDSVPLPTSAITPFTSTCNTTVFNQSINKMAIGIKYYKCPGAFVQYRDIEGSTGKFLGIWSVLMQAVFSFIGSEVPAIAGGEVENPAKNIPSAVKRIWVRIFLLYVFGVFIAGLVVPFDHPKLSARDKTNGMDYVQSSPFVIAIQTAGIRYLPQIINAFFLLSAWSAASSDVYVSSRFLFFLSRRGHAPNFLGKLVKLQGHFGLVPRSTNNNPLESQKRYVIPIFGVAVAALFAFLSYMSTQGAENVFNWLASMTSAACMLSWLSMMVTYIRWYDGRRHAEHVAEEEGTDFRGSHKELYKNKHILQPFLAWYALVMCSLILLLHGWAVFTIDGVRRIAEDPHEPAPERDPLFGPFVVRFVTSYLPVPVFLLCIFGYKLINQTNFIHVHEMDFERGYVPEPQDEPPPVNPLERLTRALA